MRIDLSACQRALEVPDLMTSGRLTRVTGSSIGAIIPNAQIGAIYSISRNHGRDKILAEVIGFHEKETVLAPFGDPRGFGPGEPIVPEGVADEQLLSPAFLGRVVNALGQAIDDGPAITGTHVVPLYRSPPNPMKRKPIDTAFTTGISVLDAMTTCGLGQRLGVFAGAGVGKSTLLGMLARSSAADVNVIALVGERGREVRAFLETALDPESLARTVVVVATGDTAPIMRVRCSFLATTLAEYFRDQGQRVLLIMDSLTRLAHAVREIGLAAGEPPTTRGYPPSVFAVMPKLLERAGNGISEGSLTAFYTVLVDGDDMSEPISDAVRSILDGHIVLSRKIAESNRYPAVDISASLSRIAAEIIQPEHASLAHRVRQAFADYDDIRELVQVGAYKAGTDPKIDRALRLVPKLNAFFSQGQYESRSLESTLGGLLAIMGDGDVH